jgi:hypothetical protein
MSGLDALALILSLGCMKTKYFRTWMKCTFLLTCLAQLTKLAETSSSKQIVKSVFWPWGSMAWVLNP